MIYLPDHTTIWIQHVKMIWSIDTLKPSSLPFLQFEFLTEDPVRPSHQLLLPKFVFFRLY